MLLPGLPGHVGRPPHGEHRLLARLQDAAQRPLLPIQVEPVLVVDVDGWLLQHLFRLPSRWLLDAVFLQILAAEAVKHDTGLEGAGQVLWSQPVQHNARLEGR